MSRDRAPQTDDLVRLALQRAPAEREAFLDAACAGDAELRAEVERQLLDDRRDATIANEGLPDASATVAFPEPEPQAAAAPGAEWRWRPDPGAAPRVRPGLVIDGRYRVESLLGQGGMGSVYRATHLALGRAVAVKIAIGGAAEQPVAVERFRREAQAIASLKHPHIVTIYDFGQAAEVGLYLVMELLHGRSLRDDIRARRRLPVPVAASLMRQVCSAVHAAHAEGIIHRDLKPENIFLEDGPDGPIAKVLDFGIAKVAAPSQPELLTVEGSVVGTPYYMSPEQSQGAPVDARSDIYSLGCVLYEMLTGEPPFAGGSAGALLVRHATEAAAPPSRARDDLPEGLDDVVLRALAKRPEDRFESAAQLARWLLEFAGHGPSYAPAAETPGPPRAGAQTGEVVRAGTVPDAPSNLPQPMTSFVGREEQIAAVVDLLKESRLVTLAGPGGVGKTRLALEVARLLLDRFPGGVWFVELAALADGALVAKAAADAIGVVEDTTRPLAESVAAFLRPRRALLLLDTCEHVLEASSDFAASLLRTCPELRVLTTGREPLALSGEAVWQVPSLGLPAGSALGSADALLRSEAVRLFADRAALSKPGFTATERNAAAIATICRRLDGIPLALELAAARVKMLTVDQIVAKLDDRFGLLTGAGRGRIARQQTLRATIDWSYELLTEDERGLLRRLSVFSGGWSLEAAETLGAAGRGSGAGQKQVPGARDQGPGARDLGPGGRDQLSGTAGAGGLGLEAGRQGAAGWGLGAGPSGAGSFPAAESIASQPSTDAGGSDQPPAPNPQPQPSLAPDPWPLAPDPRPPSRPPVFDLLARLVDKSLVVAEEHEGENRYKLLETIREYALERLAESDEEAELAERHARWFVALAERADEGLRGPEPGAWLGRLDADHDNVRAALGRWRGGGVPEELGLRLCAAMSSFWYVRGHVREGRSWLEAAAGRCGACGPALRAAVTYGASVMALALGDHRRAEALLRESLALRRATGDAAGVLKTLVELGYCLQEMREYDRAVEVCEEAAALGESLGKPASAAAARYYLGLVAMGRGHFDQASRSFGEYLAFQRAQGNALSTAIALHSLGECELRLADFARSERHLAECIELARGLGDRRLEADSVNLLGHAATGRGDGTGGAYLHRRALDVYVDIGDRVGIAYALEGIACALASQGPAAPALLLYGAATAMREAAGSPRSPAEQEELDRYLLAARERAGAAADGLIAEGGTLGAERAVETARSAAASR